MRANRDWFLLVTGATGKLAYYNFKTKTFTSFVD